MAQNRGIFFNFTPKKPEFTLVGPLRMEDLVSCKIQQPPATRGLVGQQTEQTQTKQRHKHKGRRTLMNEREFHCTKPLSSHKCPGGINTSKFFRFFLAQMKWIS